MSRTLQVAIGTARCTVGFIALLGMPSFSLSAQQSEGEALARGLGCAGCHPGLPASELQGRVPALGPGAVRPTADFVFSYLADPPRMRTVPRMPDFRLSERERLALALFLGEDSTSTGSPLAQARARWAEVGREDGETLFRALNCAACHVHRDIPAAEREGVAPDLSVEAMRVHPEWLRSYLLGTPTIRPTGYPSGSGSRMPNFRLSTAEADALAAYLEGDRIRGAPYAAGESAGVEEPLTPFRQQELLRITRDRLSCLGCHRLGRAGGRIGPSLDGVGNRLRPAALDSAIHMPGRTDTLSIMPTPLFDPDTLDELIRFLARTDGTTWTPTESVSPLDLPLSPGSARSSGLTPEAARGEVLYRRYCLHCHGPDGAGDGWNAANLPTPPVALGDSALMSLRPDDTLYDGIAAGGWVLDRSNRMPAFGGTLAGEEIRSLVAYIRVLCACAGPDWSRDGDSAR